MASNPLHILFGDYRRKILALLLLRPDERFHVRELARLTGTPPGSLHRELRLLADAELLLRSHSGNQVYYQANRSSPVFPELSALFRKTVGLADVLSEALAPLQAKIDVAFVFGSMATGEARAGSDVDLFVVGSATFTEVVGALADSHELLGREINPVIMSRDEFREKARRDPFVLRVMDDAKIFVEGGLDDLGKLATDRSA